MSAPERVRLSRTKGWRKPPNVIVVARPSRWGNPFTIAQAVEAGYLDRDEEPVNGRSLVTAVFRSWLTLGPASPWWFAAGERRYAEMRANLADLRGHDLACWCPLHEPCHADVLLEIANAADHTGRNDEDV